MKTKITLLIALLISISSFAQQGINYKAQIKDDNGNILAMTFMNVQFTIHENSATGSIAYQEDHNYTTDNNGMLILNIGSDASPSVGVFENIEWSDDLHFLQTTITYSGGTVNFDATEFMAVPYAKHAKTAGNIFSGDYNDLTNQPSITLPSGLEKITENNGTGWRLIGDNPNNYGSIGNGAIDLSNAESSQANTGAYGATGFLSVAMGGNVIASGSRATAIGYENKAYGDGSVAMGWGSEAYGNRSTALGDSNTGGSYATAMGISRADGDFATAMGYSNASKKFATAMGISSASGVASTAMGSETKAKSFAETAIGSYNTDYTPNNTLEWDINDRLFVIGNGPDYDNPNDALIVYKNGNAKFDAEIQTTTTGNANMIPIAYGTIDSNGNILSGTGNFTVTMLQSPTFQINITGVTLSFTNTSTLVTPLSGSFRIATTSYTGGDVRVHIFDSSSNQVTNTFQFVIYKL